MKDIINLSDIKPGEEAQVVALRAVGSMRRRLMDIGLIENTPVKCIGRSPAGDPSAYLIRGAVIAIRKEDTRDIMVIPIPNAAEASIVGKGARHRAAKQA